MLLEIFKIAVKDFSREVVELYFGGCFSGVLELCFEAYLGNPPV